MTEDQALAMYNDESDEIVAEFNTLKQAMAFEDEMQANLNRAN
jgi:hypothetical protein